MVDMTVSKTVAKKRVGSSPTFSTRALCLYDTTTIISVMYYGGFEDFPSDYLKVININEIFSYLKILKKIDIIYIENKERYKQQFVI